VILVDSHVHIHECYNLKDFLKYTFQNFSNHAAQIDDSVNWLGVLFLTEINDVNYFDYLTDSKQKFNLEKFGYTIISTLENNSFVISNKLKQKVIVIAGKQIIAQNGIEILALGTRNNFVEKEKLNLTIEKIIESNSVSVIPWGVGKWLGKRKDIIQKFLGDFKDIPFFLGDNSGRPNIWPEPHLFNLGSKMGKLVLPGTDALAITKEVSKTGSYGFYFNEDISLEKPYESVSTYLYNLKEQPNYFGKLETPFRFLKNQFTMQKQKHFK